MQPKTLSTTTTTPR